MIDMRSVRPALKKYRSVRRDGIAAVLINGSKVLIVRRIGIPFISHPGMWSFVTGKRDRDERYLNAAYREIFEETGIEAKYLSLLNRAASIFLKDDGRKLKWENRLFVLRSKTNTVRLNMENTEYRWVSLVQLSGNKDLDAIIDNKTALLALIRTYLRP